MTRMRHHGFTAICYVGLMFAGLGLVGCNDSTDDPIPQLEMVNPNFEGTFSGTGNLSLDGMLIPANMTLTMSLPEEEGDEGVERGLIRQQSESPTLTGTMRIDSTDTRVDGVMTGEAVDNEATVGLTLINLAGDVVQFESGHGDLIVGYDADTDAWEFAVELSGATVDGVSGVSGEFETDTIHIVVPPTNIEPRPENVPNLLDYDPIGIEAGVDYWKLPQTQREATDEGAPFLGMVNEGLPEGVFQNDTATWTLNRAISPTEMGHFSLHQVTVPGPTFFMSSADPNADPGVTLTVGLHDHFNYGFTEPGVWAVELTVSATRLDNTPTGGTGQFLFNVQDTESMSSTCTAVLQGTVSLVSDIIASFTAEGTDCNGMAVSITGNLLRADDDEDDDHGHSHE